MSPYAKASGEIDHNQRDPGTNRDFVTKKHKTAIWTIKE
jgi:hypothetical protein